MSGNLAGRRYLERGKPVEVVTSCEGPAAADARPATPHPRDRDREARRRERESAARAIRATLPPYRDPDIIPSVSDL